MPSGMMDFNNQVEQLRLAYQQEQDPQRKAMLGQQLAQFIKTGLPHANAQQQDQGQMPNPVSLTQPATGSNQGMPAVMQAAPSQYQAPQGQAAAAPAPEEAPLEQHPQQPQAPSGKAFADMSPEERQQYIKDYKQFQDAAGGPELPYGYGDTSAYKAGFVGVAIPDYEKFQAFMSQAPDQLQSLIGMLISGRLGGQQERKLPFGMRG